MAKNGELVNFMPQLALDAGFGGLACMCHALVVFLFPCMPESRPLMKVHLQLGQVSPWRWTLAGADICPTGHFESVQPMTQNCKLIGVALLASTQAGRRLDSQPVVQDREIRIIADVRAEEQRD